MIPFSPLQLKQHLFTIVNVRTNPEGTPAGTVRLNQRVVYVPAKGKTNEWHVELFIQHVSGDAKHPFSYDIEKKCLNF